MRVAAVPWSSRSTSIGRLADPVVTPATDEAVAAADDALSSARPIRSKQGNQQ